jgi:hypothetical protein
MKRGKKRSEERRRKDERRKEGTEQKRRGKRILMLCKLINISKDAKRHYY